MTTDKKMMVKSKEVIFHIKINRLQSGDKVYSVEMTSPWPTVSAEAMKYLLRLEGILDQKIYRPEEKVVDSPGIVTQEIRDKIREVLADGERHSSKELKDATGLDRGGFITPMKILVAEGWVGYQVGGKGKASLYWLTGK